MFHDPQRAVFYRAYPDRAVAMGVEGRYVWTFEGRAETEAPAATAEIVLGHQLHAQLLLFDRLHRLDGAPQPARFDGRDAMAVGSAGEGSRWRLYYQPGGHPLGLGMTGADGAVVTFSFSDWRPVEELTLPFEVLIDDGERQFTYRFIRITLNEGSLAPFRAPEAVLTDEQRLLRLHRVAMDDHLFGRTEGLQAIRGDEVVIVSDGEVSALTGPRFDTAMQRIMAGRDYAIYDDLVRPTVRISADGTLGWVIARVSARGSRLDGAGEPTGPLEFVSAWIELYERQDGAWRLTGNVSNFQPARR